MLTPVTEPMTTARDVETLFRDVETFVTDELTPASDVETLFSEVRTPVVTDVDTPDSELLIWLSDVLWFDTCEVETLPTGSDGGETVRRGQSWPCSARSSPCSAWSS